MTPSQGYTVHSDSWAAHLDDDETLVWTGLPITSFRWHTQGWFASALMVGQIAMGLFLLSLLSMAIGLIVTFHPVLIALTFAGPGLAVLALIALWNWLRRRSARYALTSKRAVVAYRFPFKSLKSYPIYRDKPILIGKTNPKSLFFAHTRRQLKYTSYRVCHGFEHLQDFDDALKHATSVQDKAPFRPRTYTGKAFTWPLKSSTPNAT